MAGLGAKLYFRGKWNELYHPRPPFLDSYLLYNTACEVEFDQRFFSLAELNAAIRECVAAINAKVMRKIGRSRAEMLRKIDRPALKQLSPKPYQYAE